MTLQFDKLLDVQPSDGGFKIDFQEQTVLWWVNGGFVAGALLRAAEQSSRHERPTSMSVQFASPVRAGESDMEVSQLSAANSAQLHEVRLSQAKKLRAIGHVWSLDERRGPVQREARMPDVPHPDELRPIEDVMEPGESNPTKFWDVFEQRPINKVKWRERRHYAPRFLRWFRYREPDTSSSLYMRAAMALPIIDTMGIPAAGVAKGANVLEFLAPTIQLSTHFYELDELDGWLLGDSYAESAERGVINSRVNVWSVRGALIAQGLTQAVTKSGEGAYVSPDKK